MIFCALAVVFFYTLGTGPAFEPTAEERAERDWPTARIVPIPACKVCHRIACPWHC